MKAVFVLLFVCALAAVASANPRRRYISKALRFIDFLSSRLQNREKARGFTWPPSFCNRLQCPRFTLKEAKPDYEIREYDASSWVSTTLKGVDYNDASRPMFMRLFDYIQGDNVANKKIPMTAPVLVSIIPGQGPACASNFNMSFYVPTGSNPPQPSESTVYLSNLPKMTVYVRSFGGFAFTYDTWRDQAIKLASAINNTNLYHTGFWYTAGYNSPFEIFNRHNEVWFIGK